MPTKEGVKTMAESGDGSLPDEERCKRNDGKNWRCRHPVLEGKVLCESHYRQGRLRQHKEPVPESLKLQRHKSYSRALEIEENPNEKSEIRVNGEVGFSNLPQDRGKRKQEENPKRTVGCSNLPRSRCKRPRKEAKSKSSVDISEDLDNALKKMNLKKGDIQLDLIRGCLSRQIEKKKGKQPQEEDIVMDLKYGRLEISSTPPIAVNNGGLSNVKVGVPVSSSVPTRVFRSKNIEPLPIAAVQILPSIKASVKAATKRCHWCRMCSYRVLVKCSTCKKLFFCEDCIRERYQDKADVKKQCPVCCGTCSCRTCIKQKSKEVKAKDLVVYTCEVKFDKAQQLLYMVDLLLPLLKQMNQEKVIELDIEAKIKGKDHNELLPYATGSQKHQCCGFCKSCIVDVHRSCGNCSYILCLPCCREFREGLLHASVRDLKYSETDKRKSLCTILSNWKTNENGSIECPAKNLGGCGDGILDLFCHPSFNLTKDLEQSGQEMVCNFKLTRFLDFDSSICALCQGNDKNEGKNEGGSLVNGKCLYFSITQDLGDKNLEHFMEHWVKGQPLIIQIMIKSELELSWDPVSMLCMYLERSVKSRKDTEVKLKITSDWCEVEMGTQQVLMGSRTHTNVSHAKLKFEVWLSSSFFQENFPRHYAAVMHALPLQQYMNPLTGILNLAAYMPPESQNLDLGPFVYISYGSPEDLMGVDSLTKLCYHAYDVVNILVHTTEIPISEKKLNKVKILLNKYSSQYESSRKSKIKTKIDQSFGKSSFSSEVTQQSELEDNTNEELAQIPNGNLSDDSSNGDSDDEDLCQDEFGSSSPDRGKLVDTCGARWDVFRREDVPKLAEFLIKYSSELNQTHLSPKKVAHPILDEIFYLDAFHKMCLKEEFDVEPWTFEQRIGEAVVIPAGCPYQVKKTKSCVNVVLGFVSPESASMGIKLNDEIRQLPVNHKAKGRMLEVKKMTIHTVNAAVEEIRKAVIDDKVEE